MARIETGVDKLVDLVNVNKKISVDDAAKKLGVSSVVVQEWADFLEEEKIISIEYRFNKTLLVERKLSKKEIKEKSEEFSTEKDAFIRRVETSLRTLESESLGLEKIKTEFNVLKKEIGNEILKVKDEVKELEKYENLKKNLDSEIENQQAEYNKMLEQAHLQIRNEEIRYKELLEKIEIEKKTYEIKEKNLLTLEEKELQLKQKLKALFDVIQTINAKIDEEKESIIGSRDQIKKLEVLTAEIEAETKDKKASIDPLLRQVKEHESQIQKIQQEILIKVRDKTAKIRSQVQEGEEATKKFQSFFNKKNEIENVMLKVDADKTALQEQMSHLIKKAAAFEIVMKKGGIKSHVAELEQEFKKVEEKRGKFKKEISSLIKLIKG